MSPAACSPDPIPPYPLCGKHFGVGPGRPSLQLRTPGDFANYDPHRLTKLFPSTSVESSDFASNSRDSSVESTSHPDLPVMRAVSIFCNDLYDMGAEERVVEGKEESKSELNSDCRGDGLDTDTYSDLNDEMTSFEDGCSESDWGEGKGRATDVEVDTDVDVQYRFDRYMDVPLKITNCDKPLVVVHTMSSTTEAIYEEEDEEGGERESIDSAEPVYANDRYCSETSSSCSDTDSIDRAWDHLFPPASITTSTHPCTTWTSSLWDYFLETGQESPREVRVAVKPTRECCSRQSQTQTQTQSHSQSILHSTGNAVVTHNVQQSDCRNVTPPVRMMRFDSLSSSGRDSLRLFPDPPMDANFRAASGQLPCSENKRGIKQKGPYVRHTTLPFTAVAPQTMKPTPGSENEGPVSKVNRPWVSRDVRPELGQRRQFCVEMGERGGCVEQGGVAYASCDSYDFVESKARGGKIVSRKKNGCYGWPFLKLLQCFKAGGRQAARTYSAEMFAPPFQCKELGCQESGTDQTLQICSPAARHHQYNCGQEFIEQHPVQHPHRLNRSELAPVVLL